MQSMLTQQDARGHMLKVNLKKFCLSNKDSIIYILKIFVDSQPVFESFLGELIQMRIGQNPVCSSGVHNHGGQGTPNSSTSLYSQLL